MLARVSHPVGARRTAAGFSLVELMVALTLGLFVILAGLMLVSAHVRENRALVHESRLVQDLRSAADLVTRSARRAGYWGDAAAGVAQGTSAPRANPYVSLTDAPEHVDYAFSRDATENHVVDTNELHGFRLQKGVIEMKLGGGGWQAVTDRGTLLVTAFEVVPSVQERALGSLCITACSPGDPHCPPRHHVRSLAVHISAQSAADPSVMRSITSEVRLRNDAVVGVCPT